MITLLFLQFNQFQKLWNVSDITNLKNQTWFSSLCLNGVFPLPEYEDILFVLFLFSILSFFPFMTSLSERKSSLSSNEAAKITFHFLFSCSDNIYFFCFNVWFINRNWFPLENICDSCFVHQRHLQSVILSPQISWFWQASHVWRTAAFFSSSVFSELARVQ